MSTPKHQSLKKHMPLAIVIALHLVAIAWSMWPNGLVGQYSQSLPAMLITPLLITYVVVWLAGQAHVWQSMPWAVIALSLIVAWYWIVGMRTGFEYLLPLNLLGSMVQFVIVREAIGSGAKQGKWQVGVRHILLWTAAVAVAIMLTRGTLSYYSWVFQNVPIWQLDTFKLVAIITWEYALLASLLAIMIFRHKFWPWIVPYVLILLPVLCLLEATLISYLFDYPWFFDWEGVATTLAQVLVLSLTLLSWRQSGLLLTYRASQTADPPHRPSRAQ